ncbi:MAG: hypothetical protein ACPL68_05965 [Candidatus Hydrothermia bacterium]
MRNRGGRKAPFLECEMYCNVNDVKAELALLGEPTRPDEEITLAISQASDLVDSFTGRHFRAETARERHFPLNRSILLYHWPVHSVVSVKNARGDDVDWEWLNQRIGEMRVETAGAVDVEYHYNDPKSPVPPDVMRTTARVAARILVGPRPDVSGFSAGETGLSFHDNPLFTQDVRWVLIKYTHRRRFL